MNKQKVAFFLSLTQFVSWKVIDDVNNTSDVIVPQVVGTRENVQSFRFCYAIWFAFVLYTTVYSW